MAKLLDYGPFGISWSVGMSVIQKTIEVMFKDNAWKIVENDLVVGSLRNRQLAVRRATEKATAATKRGETLRLIFQYQNGEVERVRILPTVRKVRKSRENVPSLEVPKTADSA